MIPESFIQELLDRVDIVDLVDSFVPLKKNGANYAACCPFHNEKSPSFTVSPTKQFYHCFGCGAHGTAISFVMEYQGLGFVDAIKDLAARVGISVPETQTQRFDSAPAVSQHRQLTDIMTQAAHFFKEQLKRSPKAIDYCKKRGLTGEIAARFFLGYAPDGWQNLRSVFPDYDDPLLQSAGLIIDHDSGRRYDRFRDRLMIPIINQKGEIIAFGGRIIDQGEPKYLNSPETPLFEKGRELFGLPQARAALREKNQAIVTEGYMDVIALAQHGVPQALATLGTATTTTHVQKLLKQVDHVVFCFDGDNAGRKAGWRALENALPALQDNKQITFAFLPDGEDPDSFIRQHGTKAFERFVTEATPLSDFLMRELANDCDLSTSEGKSKLVFDAKPLLHKLTSPLLRLQLVKRLAVASNLEQSEIERICDLKAWTPAALPKSKRPPPSLSKHLLRLVLQAPGLAHKLPVDLLPSSDERPALVRIHSIANSLHSSSLELSYALLREQIRGTPEEKLIETTAADILDFPLDPDELITEFHDAIRRLEISVEKRSFADLQRKAQHFGVSGLSTEEKQLYLSLLQNQHKK